MRTRPDPCRTFGARAVERGDRPSIAALLEAILVELRRGAELQAALPQQLARAVAAETQRPGRGLTRQRYEQLLHILPAVHHEVGEATWAIADLRTERPALYSTLVAVIGADGSPERRLGWLLRASVGTVVGEHRVEQVGEGRAGALWQVVRV